MASGGDQGHVTPRGREPEGNRGHRQKAPSGLSISCSPALGQSRSAARRCRWPAALGWSRHSRRPRVLSVGAQGKFQLRGSPRRDGSQAGPVPSSRPLSETDDVYIINEGAAEYHVRLPCPEPASVARPAPASRTCPWALCSERLARGCTSAVTPGLGGDLATPRGQGGEPPSYLPGWQDVRFWLLS